MDKLSPSKLLQRHGIEVSMDDPRTTEQIVEDMLASGMITLAIETTPIPEESTVYLEQ